jgi:outer membrane protein OmpA-like peptidoglycan-associated protein/tetratricopeptide (TPR) repeat protein
MRRIYLGILILFTLLSITQNALAQKSGVQFKRADNYYKQFDFSEALELYKIAAKKNAENLYLKGRIGNCYRFLNEIKSAEPYYEAVAKSFDTAPIYKFYYAQSLLANGKYEKGLEVMNSYYTLTGEENRIMNSIPNHVLVKDTRYKIKIEDFNSEHADFSPFLLKDELFFVSNRKDDAFVSRNDVWSQRPFTQLYRVLMEKMDVSEQEAEKETKKKPEIFNESTVSKKFHEGPVGWDASQNDLYFTRSNYSDEKPIKGADNEVNLKIVKVAFINETDEKIGDFGGKMVDNTSFSSNEYSVAYPSITEDGNYMIFTSDMPGGYGGLDLYMAENVGGMWVNAVNLGEIINTPGNEAFPHIMPNGTLYFSSDGLFGLGAYDIYESKLKPDGYFSTPQNLRAPINSIFNDFGIWIDDLATHGYFTSNRPSEYGGDDIYSFTREALLFESVIFDSKTQERLANVELVLINIDNGKKVIMTSNEDGYVSTNILPNSKYRLEVEKRDFISEKAEFSTVEDDVYAEIPLLRNFGILLDITLLDNDTKEDIPFAEFSLIELKSGKVVDVVANKLGKASFVLDADVEYRIRAAKELGNPDFVYLAVNNDFNTYGMKAPAQLYTTMELKKKCIGCEIVLEDILYDLDKYAIRMDAAKILNQLVKILADNPSLEIELASHTDCRESQKYNLSLSAKRAEAAVNYIIESGIDYRRLTATGYGESQPLEVQGEPGLYCTCEDNNGPGKTDNRCTEAMHQLNRRTSFTILRN